MEVFECRTKIIAGAGAVEALKNFGAEKLFLVTDPYFYENGTAQRVASMAQAKQTEIFHQVKPDPTLELAAEGTAQLQRFDPDLVVALGGGSAMDCAKAMRFFAKTEAKLVAIPTTSGSGSEVTDFSILTHNHVKHPLIDGKVRPDVAILDSDLLRELPAGLVADAGFDVLSHALEACVATKAGLITDALAKEAFCVVYENLAASFAGHQEVRLRIHEGATMAGMAFTQAGLGLCHAMAHSLGGKFHVAHGRLNAILLPAVVSVNAKAAGHKYGAFARAAGMGGSADTVAVRNLRNNLIRLRKELKLPETLAQAGVDSNAVRAMSDEIVRAAMADPCCETNPVPVTENVIRHILEEVTGRV